MQTVYQYTECGLDNVQIHNMEVVRDDAGEEVYEIANLTGLHRVIAHCLITKQSGLGAKELRFLRTEMEMTQAELAQIVKKDQQTIGRWERGEKPIDPNAEVVIRMIAADKLGLDPNVSTQEVAAWAVPSAHFEMIEIDGSDPECYRPLAA